MHYSAKSASDHYRGALSAFERALGPRALWVNRVDLVISSAFAVATSAPGSKPEKLRPSTTLPIYPVSDAWADMPGCRLGADTVEKVGCCDG